MISSDSSSIGSGGGGGGFIIGKDAFVFLKENAYLSNGDSGDCGKFEEEALLFSDINDIKDLSAYSAESVAESLESDLGGNTTGVVGSEFSGDKEEVCCFEEASASAAATLRSSCLAASTDSAGGGRGGVSHLPQNKPRLPCALATSSSSRSSLVLRLRYYRYLFCYDLVALPENTRRDRPRQSESATPGVFYFYCCCCSWCQVRRCSRCC